MIPVKGYPNLYRDEKTGAIINCDSQSYNQYIISSTNRETQKREIEQMKNDINEIIDACNILYNDPRYALINEIAIVSGIDRNLTYNNTLTYTEVVCAQITAFISQYHALNQNTSEVTIDLDIGSVEPLLV